MTDKKAPDWSLVKKLAAIIIGTPLAVLGFYSLQIATPFGLMAAVCVSGGLSYAYLKPAKGPVMAAVGSIVIVLLVVSLSMLLMVNLLTLPQQKVEY